MDTLTRDADPNIVTYFLSLVHVVPGLFPYCSYDPLADDRQWSLQRQLERPISFKEVVWLSRLSRE